MLRGIDAVSSVTTVMSITTKSATAIHEFVAQARTGTLARLVARVRSGWVALGDPQILPGYCLLYPDPVVTDLHILTPPQRAQFLADMATLGEAVLHVTGAWRINYEILGNVEPALHAHVIPRYASEDPGLRLKPVWLHDWNAAPQFDAQTDGPLQQRLHTELARMDCLAASRLLDR